MRAACRCALNRSSRGLTDLIRLLATDALPPIAAFATAIVLVWRQSQRAATVCVFVFFTLVTLTLAQIRSQSGIRVRINRARELLGESVVETVGGIEQVKLFGAESREAKRVGAVATNLANIELNHHRAMAKFDFAKQLTENLGAVILPCCDMSGSTGAAFHSKVWLQRHYCCTSACLKAFR